MEAPGMPNEKKWYLPDTENKEPQGPFSTSEIVNMIDEGQLSFDGYIWTESFGEDWESIHRVVEFYESFNRRSPVKPKFKPPLVVKEVEVIESADQVRPPQHATDFVEIEELEKQVLMEAMVDENIYRRFPRRPFVSSVVLHNHKKAYIFSTVDISEKGISVKVDRNFIFHPSDEVTITVRNFQEIGTFSARTVVLREFLIDGDIVLGFYFRHLNPKIRRAIAHYVQTRAQDLAAIPKAV
jgi:hypothetical protein